MSQENVEVVRRIFSEFEQGNFWVPEFFDPSIRMVWLDTAVVGKPETLGLTEMSEQLKNWLKEYERLTLSAERIVDAGEEVVVIAAWRGRGRASGVPTEWRHGQVWSFRQGKATSVISYPEPSAALEAAGLSE